VSDLPSHPYPIIKTLLRALLTVGSGDLCDGPSPAVTSHTAPQAIDKQLVRDIPGRAQPLLNQSSDTLKPYSSWKMKRSGAMRPTSAFSPVVPSDPPKAGGPHKVDRMDLLSSPAFSPSVNTPLQTNDIIQPRQHTYPVGYTPSWSRPHLDTMCGKSTPELPDAGSLTLPKYSAVLSHFSTSDSQIQHIPPEYQHSRYKPAPPGFLKVPFPPSRLHDIRLRSSYFLSQKRGPRPMEEYERSMGCGYSSRPQGCDSNAF
jgi:hypothetical protein